MNLFISRNGEHLGAWDEEDVRHYYQRGEFVATDHYWREGLEGWDTLGNLFVSTASTTPGPITPAPVPAPSRKAGKRHGSPWTSVIPLALAVVLALLIASLQPEPTAPGKVGALISAVVILILAAFPISLAFPIRMRLMVRCAILVSGGVILFIGKQQVTTNRLTAELNRLAEQKQQIAKASETAAAAQKPHDPAQDEKANAQKIADAKSEMLKNIDDRSQACRDAEKAMLELGLSPSKLTSVDEIDDRRAAIEAAQPSIQDFISYLKAMNTTIHDDLISKGVSSAAVDAFVQEMDRTGRQQPLLTYWQQEAAISADLVANLDLFKKNWGQWHIEGGKVVFNDSNVLAEYQTNLDKLKSDIALQKTVQPQVLAPVSP